MNCMKTPIVFLFTIVMAAAPSSGLATTKTGSASQDKFSYELSQHWAKRQEESAKRVVQAVLRGQEASTYAEQFITVLKAGLERSFLEGQPDPLATYLADRGGNAQDILFFLLEREGAQLRAKDAYVGRRFHLYFERPISGHDLPVSAEHQETPDEHAR